MNSPETNDQFGIQSVTPQELIRRAVALKPLFTDNALKAEQDRKPVDHVIDAVKDAGLFYHFVPRKYGGLEFDIDTFIDVVLPLGEGCASTAWVTSFCMEHNWMLAQFPEQAQDETFGTQGYVIAPGVISPGGRATVADGGYVLSGRWKWGTGIMHADWVLASGLVERPGADPDMLLFLLPVEQVEVIDTWHVDGMVGTGSNDIAVSDVFIPAHRSVRVGDMRDGTACGRDLYENPIYRMPMLPFLAITAAIPAVGAARAAVNLFQTRMESRILHGTTLQQKEKPAAQMRLAQAALDIKTAELLLRDAAVGTLAMGEDEANATIFERVRLRTQVAHVVALCRGAVRSLVEASGASAHFLDNPLQRIHRDLNVMSGHTVYDMDAALELYGRVLVGLELNSTTV